MGAIVLPRPFSGKVVLGFNPISSVQKDHGGNQVRPGLVAALRPHICQTASLDGWQQLSVAPNKSATYRADIDGTRGIAILAVLFFRAGLVLRGGYAWARSDAPAHRPARLDEGSGLAICWESPRLQTSLLCGHGHGVLRQPSPDHLQTAGRGLAMTCTSGLSDWRISLPRTRILAK